MSFRFLASRFDHRRFVREILLQSLIEIGQISFEICIYMYEASRPILSFAIGFIFPIENLLETRVRYGRTGCQNRSIEWWYTHVYVCARVCVYAVNAMNHLDSFKSDVVNPTLSLSISLSLSLSPVLILVRFSSLCSFGLSSGHGWSAVWSDRSARTVVIFIGFAKYPGIEREGKRWPQLVGS